MRSSREGLVSGLNAGATGSDWSEWEWVDVVWVGGQGLGREKRGGGGMM